MNIIEASKEGNLELVKKLINSRDGIGNTALTVAIKYGHYKIVKYLVKNNADLGNKGYYHNPLLTCALECEQKQENKKIIKLILKRVPKNEINKIFINECLQGHVTNVFLLLKVLKKCIIDTDIFKYFNFIQAIVDKGHFKILKRLIFIGFLVNDVKCRRNKKNRKSIDLVFKVKFIVPFLHYKYNVINTNILREIFHRSYMFNNL
jgi:hypothetical protein